MHPLRKNVLPLLPDEGKGELLRIKERLHNIVAYSLEREGLATHLSRFFKGSAFTILSIYGMHRAGETSSLIAHERENSLNFVRKLHDVGLGGPRAQRIFAEVMSDILTEHVNSAYAGKWTSPSIIPDQLRNWVEDHFSRLVVEILDCLKDENTASGDQITKITLTDVEKWQEVGINNLGALRTTELFDIIVDWENGSSGAIEDLKHYVTNTSARSHLTNAFSDVLTHRLLQPGASTTEILQVYISIIRSFVMLDPKGVLLDRVARPIRQYLCGRDDTVSIVVGGLLSDEHDDSTGNDVLFELAAEMNQSTSLAGEDEADAGELDWDDMSWMPDPVDAGPGKSLDNQFAFQD